MKKNKRIVIGLFVLFICLLSLTIYISFSSNIEEQEIVIKSMVPVYDETSTIEVDNNNVVFNDKNQVVKYNVVLENTQDYDVKISDIRLSTPTEEFLQYIVEDLQKDDVLAANSTKELTISLETMGIKGWGRNFADELTANISFEKVVKQEEVVPPVEDDNEEEKQPEAPATNIDEIVKESEKLEVESITNNTIEFKDGFKVEDASKVEIWIYPESEFYGYKEVDESRIIKEIVLDKNKLDELEITPGEHNIVISTEEKEVLSYVEIYINENKELLIEKSQDTIDKEENKPSVNKPSEDKKEDEEGKIENPYTSDKGLLVVLVIATGVTGLAIIIVSKNKFAKYTVFILMLSPAFTITNAEEVIEVAIKNNVSFESQNIMDVAYEWEKEIVDECWMDENATEQCGEHEVQVIKYRYFWNHNTKIKKIYIQNEFKEIDEYDFEFDVTKKQNGRVKAYLVISEEDSSYYDLYLQAEGIIYPNEDASYYFADMENLDKINNLEGIDTGNVTDMRGMFSNTAFYSTSFTLDVSNFDTSKVTSMASMFYNTGTNSTNFTLDVSNFDTSNVTDMSYMFNSTGYSSEIFTLDVSNFDTSNVTNMSHMFCETGHDSTTLTLDLSGFDTSKVTDMGGMFLSTGYSSTEFTLDLGDKFDTSNATNMSRMFYETGYNSTKLNTSITISNPNTTLYSDMFYDVATKQGSQIKVNFTKENELLANKMLATVSEDSNVIMGVCTDCGEGYVPIGTEISIGDEKFNVISQTDDTVTMLAQYNLGTDYRQSSSQNKVRFANTNGWEYTPGPKEIDIQIWSTNPKTYVNAYVEYLKTELEDDSVTGDLITLTELKDLGCTIPSAYEYVSSSRTCTNSPYKSWLINNQGWWSRSANSSSAGYAWFVNYAGSLDCNYYNFSHGVRPVITISKSSI